MHDLIKRRARGRPCRGKQRRVSCGTLPLHPSLSKNGSLISIETVHIHVSPQVPHSYRGHQCISTMTCTSAPAHLYLHLHLENSMFNQYFWSQRNITFYTLLYFFNHYSVHCVNVMHYLVVDIVPLNVYILSILYITYILKIYTFYLYI